MKFPMELKGIFTELIRYNPFSNNFIKSAFIFCFVLIVYTFIRIGFYSVNHSVFTGLNFTEIIQAFITGIKFDISGILYSNIIVLFLYNIPIELMKHKLYRTIIYILFFTINILMLGLSLADYGYFSVTERRITYEVFTMMKDVMFILPGLALNHYILTLIYIAVLVLFIYLFRYIYKIINAKINVRDDNYKRVASFILIILLTITGIRGGLQLRPIRPANAFFTAHTESGYIAMSTPFNIIFSSFQQQTTSYKFFDESKAADVTRDMLKRKDETFLYDDYPFLRKKSGADSTKKLNIIIFIMEGWSATFCGTLTGDKSYTPFFDSLSNSGLLFTNFFANGQRSIESIPSILTSVPSLSDMSIINSHAELDKFRGLGEILKEQGYSTSFHHGAHVGSMGFDGFARIAGIDKYFGMEDYKGDKSLNSDETWGIADEPFFLESLSHINELQQPFCSVIFSLSSHDPYFIPEYRRTIFDNIKDETELQKSVRYADFSLYQFFQKSRETPWFSNTLFIITADHTNYNMRSDLYNTFHVPCLIYAPGIIKPERNSRTASHINILPTLIDILNINTIHSSMGNSLFNNETDGFTVVKRSNEFALFYKNYCLVNNLEQPAVLYNINELSKSFEVNSDENLLNQLNTKLLSYLQTSTSALTNDKIYK